MKAIFWRRVVVDPSSRLTKLLAKPIAHSHPNQSRLFRTPYLPSSPSPPPISRFDPSLLWRSEKIRGGSLASAFGNKATKLASLAESRVGIFGSQFPKKGFQFGGFSEFQRRGWKRWFQGLSSDDVVLGLLLANTAVFLMWRVFDNRFMMNNFMISLDNFKSGRLHTLITSAFSHIDIGHIISNMIGLYFFGTSIAINFGPQFLLKLYLSGALGGSVFYLIHHAYKAASSPKALPFDIRRLIVWGGQSQGAFMGDPSRTPGLGASGAVNAIILLDIFLHPKATLYFEFFIPVPAMLLGIFLIGKDILRITEGDSNISGSAHLGGAAVAAITWARIRRGRFPF